MLDEVLPVGSQKKGVALAGCKTADAVIIFKKPPNGNVTMVTDYQVLVIIRCHGNKSWSTCSRYS